MCHLAKFRQNGQTVFEISRFLDVQDGRCLPSWIFTFLNFRLMVILRGLMCIAIPSNFTKIGQMVADRSHLTIFKLAAVRHVRFLKVWVFDQLISTGGLICAIVQNFVKIGLTVSEISRFFDFQDGCCPPSWILKFWNFLVDGHIGRNNMHRHTKVHQNRLNGCWNIAFNYLQNGDRPPSSIFKSLIFDQLVISSCKISSKLAKRFLRYSDFFLFSRWPPSAILDLKFWNFCFPIKNWG